MSTKQQDLDSMLRMEQKNQFSSEQEQNQDQIVSKTQYKKPLKNTFSDPSEQSDSDKQQQNNKTNNNPPLPSKPPQPPPTALKQIQHQIKWDKSEQLQIQILTKLEQKGIKDKKIKQLAIKYKSLNLAYEKQKIQRKNLQNQINSFMKNNEETKKNSVQKKQKKDTKSIQKTNPNNNCSNCQQNDKKIMDFRLKNQNLKSQLNKTMRLLTKQLGQDFNIDEALRDENSWKGRQQKIQKLKSRVRQLQDKLANNGINVSHMSGLTQTTLPPTFTRTSALLAESKKKQLDNLKTQVDALKNQNQLLQGKIKSLLSRKSILENQLKQLKIDFDKKKQLFIQKSQNDDKLIQLLKQENNKIKKQQKIITKIIYKDDNHQIISQLKKQIQDLKKKIKFFQSNTQEFKDNQNKQMKKINKDINSVGGIPPQKKKKLQEEYVNSDKYLNKMSAHDEEQLYKNWKNNLNKKN